MTGNKPRIHRSLARIGRASLMIKTKGRVINIVNKGLVSILDQGLFSGMNFVVSILLGRWLLPVAYGSYSVAMSIFLLASGVYSSIVLEPMSVFGSKAQQNQSEKYSGSILIMHTVTTACVALILYLSTFLGFLGLSESASAIRIMALTMPMVLAFWLARWSFYTQSRPAKALKITVFYSIGILASIIILKLTGLISSEMVFLTTGLVSLLSSTSILWGSRKHILRTAVIEHTRMHWGYGKVILVASILQWFSTQFYLVLVSTNLSLTDGAGYRAIQNLAQPLEQVATAMGLLLIPWFSRRYANEATASLKKIHWVNWVLGLFGLLYLVAAWEGKDFLVHAVYQGKYDAYTWLIPYMIGFPIIISLSKGAQIGVRVLEKPGILLIAYLGSGIVTVIFGPVLINGYGLKGAAIGRLLSAVAFSLFTHLLYRREAKELKYKLSITS